MKLKNLTFLTLTMSLTTIGLTTTVQKAQAIVIRDDVSESKYQELGNQYPSVGSVLVNGGGQRLCSGTLVDPQWVLSAAHCLKPGASVPDVTSGNFTINNTKYNVDSVKINPGFADTRYNQFAGSDVGLVKLSSPVTNVKPAEFYTDSQLIGQKTTFVGYGNTGNGLIGQQDGSSGTKRAGENVIDGVGSQVNPNWSDRVFVSDFDAPDGSTKVLGSSTSLPLEYATGTSDSGGGAFIGGKLAGVHSGGKSTDRRYGSVFGVTQVKPNLDWIQSTISGTPKLTAESSQVDSDPNADPSGVAESGNIPDDSALALNSSSNGEAISDQGAKTPEPSTVVALLLTGSIFGLFRRCQINRI
jgi:secreted trypsin-like serine protease